VTTRAEYRRYLNSNYAPCGTEMFELYPATSPADIKAAVDSIITDALFAYGAHSIAQAEQDRGQQTFLYRFSRGSRDPKRASLGAWHGAEIPYIFGLADPTLTPSNFDARDKEIAEQMMDAWTNFARTGNPNGASLPRWPTATLRDENYIDFGNTTAVYGLMKKRNFAVFDRLFKLQTRTVEH
jgi:para-nitrobenzyl esterase